MNGAALTAEPVPAPPADAPAAERATPKGLILSFAVLLGWAALLRKIWRGRATWPEALALACLFLTLLTLPTRFFFLSAQPAFGGAIVLALVGWATLLANTFLSLMQKKDRTAQPAVSVSRRERIFSGLLLLIIAAGLLWSFLMAVVVVPDDWDAWAIWGSKAKVLALGSGPLEDVTRFGHADYPLLWPTIWAFSGWLSGGWEECWSKGWGAVFLLLCVWEMRIAVSAQSGSRTAGLAGRRPLYLNPQCAAARLVGLCRSPALADDDLRLGLRPSLAERRRPPGGCRPCRTVRRCCRTHEKRGSALRGTAWPAAVERAAAQRYPVRAARLHALLSAVVLVVAAAS